MAPRNENRKVVTFKELLALAHGNLRSVHTEIVQLPTIENGNMAIFRAVVTMRDADGDLTFHGTGDAAPTSLRADMVQHLVRIAETRAVVRALRLAVGVGDTAAEELAEYVEPVNGATTARAAAPHGNMGPINTSGTQCPLCRCPDGKAHLRSCPSLASKAA